MDLNSRTELAAVWAVSSRVGAVMLRHMVMRAVWLLAVMVWLLAVMVWLLAVMVWLLAVVVMGDRVGC